MDVAFNGTDRKKYIDEYLQLEEDLDVAISAAYDRKEMSDYQSNVHLARKQLEAFAAARIYGSLQDINADSTTEAIRQLEMLENVHFKALVDSVPSLQVFSSRVHKQLQLAKFRDEEMVQQILRYIQEYRGKRIVVVVGFLHRYYQLDKLAPKREQLNFKILDINGFHAWLQKNLAQHKQALYWSTKDRFCGYAPIYDYYPLQFASAFGVQLDTRLEKINLASQLCFKAA
jgi:hypothetical protein